MKNLFLVYVLSFNCIEFAIQENDKKTIKKLATQIFFEEKKALQF